MPPKGLHGSIDAALDAFAFGMWFSVWTLCAFKYFKTADGSERRRRGGIERNEFGVNDCSAAVGIQREERRRERDKDNLRCAHETYEASNFCFQ